MILVALLPLAALAAYLAWQEQYLYRLGAHGEMLGLSRVAAESGEGFARETRALLAEVASDPALLQQDAGAVRQSLAHHLAAYPEYVNLWAAGAGGTVYADPQADPAAPPRHIGDEPYFQEAMATGQVSFQTVVQETPAGRRVSYIFCQPVLDDGGRPAGTLQASFEPGAVEPLASPAPLPPGVHLVLLDPQGTILLHSADPERWLGQAPPEAVAVAREQREFTRERVFLQRSALLSSATVVAAPWRVVAAAPAERALAPCHAALWRHALFFAGALALALFLGLRSAALGRQGWQRNAFLSSLLDSASVGVAVVRGPENRLQVANPAYERLTGQPEETVAGRALREVLPEAPAHEAEANIDEVYRTGRTVRARETPVPADEAEAVAYWDVDYVPLPADGRVDAVLMLAVPVTDKVHARWEVEALARRAERQAGQLQAVLTAMSESVWVFDADEGLTFINDVTARALGVEPTPEALRELAQLARTLEVYRPDGTPLQGPDRHVPRALRGETFVGEEVLYRPPGGGPLHWAGVSAAPVRDGEGRISGAVLTAMDITPQKEAQAERERLLAEVESAHRNLQTILNRLPDGVMAIDLEQRITLRNDTLALYLGRDVLGLSLADLRREAGFVTADGRPFPEGQTPAQRALRGEAVTGVEAALRLPDGRRVHALESAAPLYGPDGDPAGRVAGAVVALTDITALKEAQAERERLLAEVEGARENLRTILDQLPEIVLVVDPNLRVTLCNDAVRRYIGRDATGMHLTDLGRDYQMLAPGGEPFAPGEAPLERALRGEAVAAVEATYRLPDGRRIDVLESAAPLRGPDGRVREAAAVLTDVTSLKEVDRAKDQFFSVAAHELRTPLTALKGHAQILLRRAARAGWALEDQRSLQVIDDQVDRLNDLIGRLLDVSRIRLGRLQLSREPTDIVALARQVAADLQVTTEAHRISLEAEVPQLVGQWDPASLRQVLSNLIGNAIKYAPGGPIDIRIRHEDGQAVVSVSDRGPGISPERLTQLFQPFTRGTPQEYREAGGLGLGLFISRGIVEAHGGRIWVESEVGVGTTFTFTLPLGEPDAQPLP